MNYDYLTSSHSYYLKSLVRQAGQKDYKHEIFGSSKHRYQLNPVVTLDEIRAFEERYGIKLPEELIFFYTTVGNGGAGPFYGIYTLDELIKYHNCPEYIKNEAYLQSELSPDDWEEKMEIIEDDGQYDTFEKSLYGGLLIMGIYHYLMRKK